MFLQLSNVTRQANRSRVTDTPDYFLLSWCPLVPVNEMLLGPLVLLDKEFLVCT